LNILNADLSGDRPSAILFLIKFSSVAHTIPCNVFKPYSKYWSKTAISWLGGPASQDLLVLRSMGPDPQPARTCWCGGPWVLTPSQPGPAGQEVHRSRPPASQDLMVLRSMGPDPQPARTCWSGGPWVLTPASHDHQCECFHRHAQRRVKDERCCTTDDYNYISLFIHLLLTAVSGYIKTNFHSI